MLEIIKRFSLFSCTACILIGGFFYLPFAILIDKINRQFHLKIAHKMFQVFLKTLNNFTDEIFIMEGNNLINSNENYLILSNHVNYYDFLVISKLFEKSNTLGHLKYVIKSEMKQFCGIFKILDLLKFLTIERDFEKDQITMKKYFEQVVDTKTNLNIVLFPEGTIITENTMNKSKEFRKNKNLDPLKYVLSPKYKGLDLILKCLKDSNIKNILDITFTYPDCNQPSLWEIFFKKKKYRIKYTMNVKRIESISDTKTFLELTWNNKENWIGESVNYNERWFIS